MANMNDHLLKLAQLIKQRNQVDEQITQIIGRPAIMGHIGEYIAASIFEISLYQSAVTKGSDGVFQTGALQGKSVNIKFYGKQEGILDIREDALPDYFMVLSGPKSSNKSSKGKTRLMSIDYVYLFEVTSLIPELRKSGKKIGVATSIPTQLWEKAEIYPASHDDLFSLTYRQQSSLALFGSSLGTN
jgi:hypothetical protein